MSIPMWTLTSETVTVILDGETHSFQKGTPNYDAIRRAIEDGRPEDIVNHLTIASSIEQWAKGEFTVTGENVFYKGARLPTGMNKRIVACASEGKDPTFLFRFWERLKKNPSKRSVDQLWQFLAHLGIPITEDGCFLAYKSVRLNWMDHHTSTIENKVGAVVDYDRNKVSDDPREACHEGLHVGAIGYASTFGGEASRIIICKVDPENVVCVPYDYSFQKMRLCHYEVVGVYAGVMPSTTIDSDDVPPTVNENPESDRTAGGIWGDFDLLDYEGLQGKSLDLLRKYAVHGLKVAGASKLVGGKDALVRKILEVRGEVGFVDEDDGDIIGSVDGGFESNYDATHPETPDEEPTVEPTSDFPEFDAKGYEELLECSTGDLRKYATYGLKMVGASKVPGGKDALVRRILSARG